MPRRCFTVLLFCLSLAPGGLQAEEVCAIHALRMVVSAPDTVRFRVDYFIPSDYANPCFISAQVPSTAAPAADFRVLPAGGPLGVAKGERRAGDAAAFSVTYAGPQTITTRTIEVIISDRNAILCSRVFALERQWEPRGASLTGLTLERTLLARTTAEAENRDRDRDGLIDDLENQLAQACRPYLVFDHTEDARARLEPVTLFQVRPLDLGHYGRLRIGIAWILLYSRDGGYPTSTWCRGPHAGDIETARYELVSHDGGTSWDIMAVDLGDRQTLGWRAGAPGLATYGYHPVLTVSAGTHHLFFSSAYDRQASPYSRRGCPEAADGKGAFVMPDLRSLSLSGFNNVGESKDHPSPPFVDTLARIFPSQSAWGEGAFLDEQAGLISDRWMNAAWKGEGNREYWLQAYSHPEFFVRHRRYLGELTRLYSSIERQSATFRIVPGLADPTLVSFEAVRHPGFYLRAQDGRIKIMPLTNDDTFRAQATFWMVPGLADRTGCSFESFDTPGAFIRQRDFHLYLEQGTEATFAADATFRLVRP